MCDTLNRNKKSAVKADFFCVAGPGGAPGLEDYEPSVRLYTTPHVFVGNSLIIALI